MSANNKIQIYKEEGEWRVDEVNAETGIVIEDLGGWADLESAVRVANNHMEENEVEYGYHIDL